MWKWKRVTILLGALLIVGWASDLPSRIGLSKPSGPALAVVSAAMLDAETGKWLYRSDSKEALPPASMSKMMTEAIVLDAMRSGAIGRDDPVVASDYAANVGGAGMGLAAGQAYPAGKLFDAMAVHSANDAAVALAEHVAGSEKAFKDLMNAKAKEIGLSRATRFANSTGLSSTDLQGFGSASSDGETLMTAEDAALLAKYLIDEYPELLRITRQASVKLAGAEAGLPTTNEMLPGQRFGTKGNDGLKTGYTERAGYCFTGSTVLNGKRYITVVMGARTPEARFEETKKLLDYAKEIAR